MFDRASLKLGLDKAVLQSMNTTQGGKIDPNATASKQLTKKEVEDLLKRGGKLLFCGILFVLSELSMKHGSTSLVRD